MSKPYSREDVCRYLGIGLETLKTHRRRGTFPEPVAKLGRSPYWHQDQLDEWRTNHPRDRRKATQQ